LFSNYHRGMLARDDYDATLFKGATIADLPSRPALYLNSFDVANHVRFVFSKHYIDTGFYQPKGHQNMLSAPKDLTSENDLAFINVDPKSVRLADAVAASSAFPFRLPQRRAQPLRQQDTLPGQVHLPGRRRARRQFRPRHAAHPAPCRA